MLEYQLNVSGKISHGFGILRNGKFSIVLENQKSYRQIAKATSLFGGVQVINILVSIIRSKAAALLLGPSGMGIMSLFTTTLGFIEALSNFGLRKSAVRTIAAANETENTQEIVKVTTVFRRLVWATGLLGTIITLMFSGKLSQLAFGNQTYQLAFVWLSITLLLNQLASGRNVILQGLRKLRLLATANVIGSVVGLFISIPIYYVWQLEGIVPTIILSSISSLLIAFYLSRKIQFESVSISFKKTFQEGKGMLVMGFMLSISAIITNASSVALRSFISTMGGVSDVGLFSAGFTIIGTYVGLVFSAMSTDYYPRLSGVSHDNLMAANLINQQAELAILILSPLLILFLVFIDLAIILLYSNDFVAISEMVQWAVLGMYFKAASWAVGFLFLAKGASMLFFWSELLANSYMLGLNLLAYYFYGLEGLGISFLVGYTLIFLQVVAIAIRRYDFAFNPVFYRMAGVQLALGVSCFCVIKVLATPWDYLAGVPFFCLSAWHSLIELDKKIGIKDLLTRFRK